MAIIVFVDGFSAQQSSTIKLIFHLNIHGFHSIYVFSSFTEFEHITSHFAVWIVCVFNGIVVALAIMPIL